MSLNIIICVVLYTFAMLQSISLIIFLLVKGRKTHSLYSLLICQILVFLWLFFGLFEETYSTIDQLWLYTKLAFFPISFMGACWLIFCMYYTKRLSLCNKFLVAPLLGLSSLFYLSVLTTEHHHLFIRSMEIGKPNEWGILFPLFALQGYSCFFIGIVMLVIYSIKQYKRIRKSLILLCISVTIPIIINVLTLAKIIPSPGFDLTPTTLSLTFTLITLAIFKYKFLDIMPFALKEIVESMKESMLVIDNNNHIIDFNKSFSETFNHCVNINKEDSINAFIEKLKAFPKNTKVIEEMSVFLFEGDNGYFEGEINVSDVESMSYLVNIRPISNKKSRILGKILTFNNITSYKQLVNALNNKNTEVTSMNEELVAMNEELIGLNEQLKDYADTVEKLAVANERNRLARDVHDTLGQTLGLLITLLQVSILSCKKDGEETEGNLDRAVIIAKEGLNEVRRSISGLVPENLEENNLFDALESLVNDYKCSGMNIELSVNKVDQRLDTEYTETLYRICQEALTNSVKHGKATEVSIILKFTDSHIRLFIFDNGLGCKDIGSGKGFGLKGMKQRVEKLNGEINFGSDGEKGFNVHVEIPLATK